MKRATITNVDSRSRAVLSVVARRRKRASAQQPTLVALDGLTLAETQQLEYHQICECLNIIENNEDQQIIKAIRLVY